MCFLSFSQVNEPRAVGLCCLKKSRKLGMMRMEGKEEEGKRMYSSLVEIYRQKWKTMKEEEEVVTLGS
jgi:hypothetical protein